MKQKKITEKEIILFTNFVALETHINNLLKEQREEERSMIFNVIEKRIKKNMKGYKMTKPPEEIDHLNMFRQRLEELNTLKEEIIKGNKNENNKS